MGKENIRERNLITIVIFAFATLLVLAILYNLSFILKIPANKTQKQGLPKNEAEEKAQKSDEAYRRLIEKSKTDYKDFMEQNKSRLKSKP